MKLWIVRAFFEGPANDWRCYHAVYACERYTDAFEEAQEEIAETYPDVRVRKMYVARYEGFAAQGDTAWARLDLDDVDAQVAANA